MVNQDFRDLVAEFNAHEVEYLVVGAHAQAAPGIVRATNAIDFWVCPTVANAKRVFRALAVFGAPLHDLTEEDLATPGLIFQIGVPPVRVDVITSIDGVEFDQAWPARLQTRFGDQPISVLSIEHLIQNKRAAGRLQDMADVERLERLLEEA